MSTYSGKSGLNTGMLLILLVSAVLNSLSLMYINFFLSFGAVSLVLYLLIKTDSGKLAFYSGVLFGGVSSLLLNYWMIPVVADYAKGNIVLGLVCYAASAIVLAVFFGVQFYLSILIKYQLSKRFSHLINAFFFASLWVLFELIRADLFSAMPWLSYSIGITQGRSLLLIQPAAYGGVLMLSFIILIAAYYVAWAYYTKKRKLLFVALAIIGLQYASGYFLYTKALTDIASAEENKFSVALIMPGLSPETVWNEESADGLVSHLFALNKKAVESKSDLIVWTETVVPWTYSPDDDFLKELSAKKHSGNTHAIIGMNSAFTSSGGTICNSVYLLNPDGKEQGRYDKQDLLTLVEKPLLSQSGSLVLPFMSSYDLQMNPGNYKDPIKTPWGKAGIMICNESTNSSIANNLVKKGAGFLVNMGNNNWFSDYFITQQHFYNCRLRAVENRKDMIINNNMGVCGLVRASGDIVVHADGKKSQVKLIEEIRSNNLSSSNSPIFLYFIMCVLFGAVINLFYSLHYFKTKS